MQHSRGFAGIALFTIALAACSDSTDLPSERRLEGTYQATTFTIETPDTVFDQLKERNAISLTLNSDGTTGGSLFVSNQVTDLAGQWDTLVDTLRLHMSAPSFLTRVPFSIAPNQLSGEFRLQNGAIHVTLTR